MSTSQTTESIGITRTLVRAVRGIRWDETPGDAREVARHCLLDFFGVAIAGSREALTEILINEVVSSERSSEASLIGRTERAL
jgi:2-methylcitrate dehydratase PrpD